MQKIYYVKAAQENPDDEFLTPMSLITEELPHYHQHMKDKVVFCNTDRPDSNFVKYLQNNQSKIGFADLIYSDADFRSKESRQLLQQADVVVTNPPFSLFRRYIKQLYNYNKKFLIIGPVFALTYKYIYKKITSNELYLGKTGRNPSKQGDFIKPDGKLAPKSYRWFQNITYFPAPPLRLKADKTELQTDNAWERYDGTNIVNLDRASNVASCCESGEDLMGVPVTFFDKWDPSQFNILAAVSGSVSGKNKFKRLLLQKL